MTKQGVRGYPNEPVTTSVRSPSRRSAFSAGFLSFIFPGLGQAYAGAYVRALVLAAPLLIAIVAAIAYVLTSGIVNFGLWLSQSSVLGPLAIANVVILAYRALASLDAYRLAIEPATAETTGFHRFGRKHGQINPMSLAGLGLILIILISGHLIVGYWDLKFYNLAVDIHAPLVIPTNSPEPSSTPEPTPTFPPQETLAPAATIQPWTGTSRLNIQLVGMDIAGSHTDSMIVVSIDPVSHQVALFSVLRDALDVPMPPKSRLSQLFGPTFTLGPLTNLWKDADPYRKLFPGGGADALKQALGYTFFGNQNAIQYYAEVGFSGFEKVVDTLGGVTIDSPAPVLDDGYPSNTSYAMHLHIYFPAGIQHLDGYDALTYARIGHSPGSSNFFRAIRQQQVVVALEQQANFNDISAHLSDLVDELGQSVHTDIPEGPDVLGPMLQLAKTIKPTDIKSYVWGTSHPSYSAIRTVVKSAIAPAAAPDELQAAINEAAAIVVENGTGISGQDTTVANYLQDLGLNAQASTDQPAVLGGTTKLLCVNGADTQFPATLAELEQTLGLTGTPSASPSAPVQIVTDTNEGTQFVIVTGTDTPTLTAAPN
jgi:LCP family protein required for cell wall assembly